MSHICFLAFILILRMVFSKTLSQAPHFVLLDMWYGVIRSTFRSLQKLLEDLFFQNIVVLTGADMCPLFVLNLLLPPTPLSMVWGFCWIDY